MAADVLHTAAKAVDAYVVARSAPVTDDVVPVDARLEAIVERMFQGCERDGEYKQVRLNCCAELRNSS